MNIQEGMEVKIEGEVVCGQDMQFYKRDFPDTIFTVERYDLKSKSCGAIKLTAPKFGGKGDYGNGAISLTASQSGQVIPFNPVVEIRPTDAGEVWQYDENKLIYFVIHRNLQGDNGIECILRNGVRKEIGPAMIHGQNGWTLLYSPNKEVMERIKEDDKVQSLMNEIKEFIEGMVEGIGVDPEVSELINKNFLQLFESKVNNKATG